MTRRSSGDCRTSCARDDRTIRSVGRSSLTEILAKQPEGRVGARPVLRPWHDPARGRRLGLPPTGSTTRRSPSSQRSFLTDYPFRDWSDEPQLPFGHESDRLDVGLDCCATSSRARRDRPPLCDSMAEFYPHVDGSSRGDTSGRSRCRARSAASASRSSARLLCARPVRRKERSPARAFDIAALIQARRTTFEASSTTARPRGRRRSPPHRPRRQERSSGKSAVCPFCDHVHPLAVSQRLAREGLGEDALLVAADTRPTSARRFGSPTTNELEAA